MAVDYVHRLIVRGSHKDIRTFRREIYRRYPRKIGRKSWIEIVPFSFTALYQIAPAARRIEPEIPRDAYDMSVWPIRQIGKTRAEIRYKFHTRNLEMADLIRVLARARPALTFTLLTFCLDDMSIELYRFSGGRTKKWEYPEGRREFHWDRARAKFGLSGDDVYDDEEAEHWAEEEMLHEALYHWERAGSKTQSGRERRYDWWNRPPLRDLMTEKQLFVLELEEKLKSKAPRHKAKRHPQREHSANKRAQIKGAEQKK
jgi:hypothetical protein